MFLTSGLCGYNMQYGLKMISEFSNLTNTETACTKFSTAFNAGEKIQIFIDSVLG